MVPKTHEFQEPKCELITKALTIDVVGLDINDFAGFDGDPRAVIGVLMVSGVIFTASVVVSGSILVAGNTVHWIEQEGTCDDGKIRNAVADLSGSLASMGGMVVTTSKELIDWLMFWKEQAELESDTLIEADNKLDGGSSPDEIESLLDEKQTDAMKSSDDVILNNKSEN